MIGLEQLLQCCVYFSGGGSVGLIRVIVCFNVLWLLLISVYLVCVMFLCVFGLCSSVSSVLLMFCVFLVIIIVLVLCMCWEILVKLCRCGLVIVVVFIVVGLSRLCLLIVCRLLLMKVIWVYLQNDISLFRVLIMNILVLVCGYCCWCCVVIFQFCLWVSVFICGKCFGCCGVYNSSRFGIVLCRW